MAQDRRIPGLTTKIFLRHRGDLAVGWQRQPGISDYRHSWQKHELQPLDKAQRVNTEGLLTGELIG